MEIEAFSFIFRLQLRTTRFRTLQPSACPGDRRARLVVLLRRQSAVVEVAAAINARVRVDDVLPQAAEICHQRADGYVRLPSLWCVTNHGDAFRAENGSEGVPKGLGLGVAPTVSIGVPHHPTAVPGGRHHVAISRKLLEARIFQLPVGDVLHANAELYRQANHGAAVVALASHKKLRLQDVGARLIIVCLADLLVLTCRQEAHARGAQHRCGLRPAAHP